MIYKSRNGIGIRVILITLFFFFMLTDAKPNDLEMKELADKCNGLPSFSPRDINPDFNNAQTLKKKLQLGISAIKTIKQAVKAKERYKNAFIVFAVVCFVLIVLWLCVYFKSKIAKIGGPDFLNPSSTTICIANDLYSIGCFWGWIIFAVIAVLFIMFSCFGCRCSFETEIEACNKLKEDIAQLLINDMEANLNGIMLYEDTEKAIIEDMLKKLAKSEIGNEEDVSETIVEKIEVVKESRFEEYQRNQFVKDFWKDREFKEFKQTQFVKDFRKDIEFKEFKQTQFVKDFRKEDQLQTMKQNDTERKNQLEEMKEKEVVRDEKVSAVEKKQKEFIEEKQKSMESAKREEKLRREKRDEKKDDREESPLAKIDVNLFIYAMVFVFALFAICTICNFKEEKETREIIEV